jgi:hypothetical protein
MHVLYIPYVHGSSKPLTLYAYLQYRAWQQRGHFFIQMDLAENGSLGQFLRQVPTPLLCELSDNDVCLQYFCLESERCMCLAAAGSGKEPQHA